MTRAREFVGRFGSGQDPDGTLDENGFRHFEGPQDDGAAAPDAGRFRRRVPPDVSSLVVGPGAPGRQGPRRGGPRGVRALVTGSNGLIGSNIVRVLLDQGHEVRGLVRATSDLRALEGLGVEQVPGDVLDRASLEAAMRGCDTVFHTAGIFTYAEKDQRAARVRRPRRDAQRAAGRRQPGCGPVRADVVLGHLRLGAAARAPGRAGPPA